LRESRYRGHALVVRAFSVNDHGEAECGDDDGVEDLHDCEVCWIVVVVVAGSSW
jgi:hypothetical protein